MKYFYSILLSFSLLGLSSSLLAQGDADFLEIEKILHTQSKHWNNGDIDAFMESYWNSPDLQFIGSSGITYGWQKTLKGYKKRYPNKEAMGKLTFEILDMTKRSKKVISMVGKFSLARTIGDLSGHFLLIWQKKKGEWVIVADCTSAIP